MSAETIHATASVEAETPPRASVARGEWWLFGPRADVCVFGGSAALSLLLLLVGARAGVLWGDSPEWAWVPAVLLVDVAHVYATGFRVYFDAGEFRRRASLYILAPAIAFALGVALYSEGEAVFWRALAYLAVFHFVRQQYGWVALYRARAGERGRAGFVIDSAAVYMATLYPLAYWHANLPRRFWWFLPGDFAGAPAWVERVAFALYCVALCAYAPSAAQSTGKANDSTHAGVPAKSPGRNHQTRRGRRACQ